MQQLSFADTAMMLPETPRTPNQLCMAQIYDPSTAEGGRPSFGQILDKIEACLPAAPMLRRRLQRVPLGLDRPYWVDDVDFDLEYHIRHLALPEPGDWRQFCVQVARLHARPLDMTRPPWEMTVIEGLDGIDDLPRGCFATVLKLHHSAADGQSGVALLGALHDLEPRSSENIDEPEPWVPETPPTSGDLLRRAAVNSVVNPVGTVRTVATNSRPLLGELARAVRRRPTSVPVEPTRFNQTVSAHRVYDEARCALDDLKRVKNAVPGATVNDVCLSIIGDGMHRYLDSIGEPPKAPLVALVPVSTRASTDASAGGNEVSGMRLSLHTDVTDPLQRVAAIAATTATKKAAQNGVAVPVMLEVAQVLPGLLLAAGARAMSALAARGAVFANTIVTNVPGSPVPMYLLGCELVRSTGCVPLADSLGLFHCCTSYAGTFTFMFTADRDMLPDPVPYASCIDEAIASHVAAVNEPDEPSRKSEAKKRAPAR